MMQTDLMNWLRGDAELAEACAKLEDVPVIHWVKTPRDAAHLFPRIVMKQVSPGQIKDQKGADALSGPRIQFDIYSSGAVLPARIVANRLIKMLDIKKDVATGWPGFTQGATHFPNTVLESDRDMAVTELEDGVDIFHISCDFIIWNRPAGQ